MAKDKELALAVSTDPLTWIPAMIAQGIDPEKMHSALDFVREWQKSRAVDAYNRAMVECQKAMPIVVKDAKNPHTKSDYVLVETIQKQCKPIWMEHGFSLSFSEAIEQAVPNMIRMKCDVRHREGHVETHYANYPRDGEGAKGGGVMSAIQGTVSSHSYAERDMTTLIFNIVVAGRDKDGNNPAAKVSPDQIGEINDLIEQIRKAGLKHDHAIFLGIFGIKDLADMKVSDSETAIRLLKAKLPKQASF